MHDLNKDLRLMSSEIIFSEKEASGHSYTNALMVTHLVVHINLYKILIDINSSTDLLFAEV